MRWTPLTRVPVSLRIVELQPEFSECWRNDRYSVLVNRHAPHTLGDGITMVHLSIKRLDQEVVHDWRHLQKIKSEIVGAECEAVELYPAESRLVDGANQFHLWCLAVPQHRWPFGFEGPRQVGDAQPNTPWKQRKIEQDVLTGPTNAKLEAITTTEGAAAVVRASRIGASS